MDREQVRKKYKSWIDSLPVCPKSCDGDLVGEEHDIDCPVGQAGGFKGMFDAYVAGRDQGIEQSAQVAQDSTGARPREIAEAIRALKGEGDGKREG
jgi:hypothetical protein